MTLFDLPSKEEQVKKLEAKTLESDFWQDKNQAQKIIKQINTLKNTINGYQELVILTNNFLDELKLLKEEYSEEMHELLEKDFKKVSKKVETFEMLILLNQDYDYNDALVEIHPGAGGTESQDWAEMLLRMYVRYSESKDYKVEILDYQAGDEAGIKSVTFIVHGPNAYGYLKAEQGVHRLVRISPFDASGRRHTSFSSVEVIPVFNEDSEVVVDEADLRIDTYRASGAGGQHVNKTDSAVRITHLPTGIVVCCQSQRSQMQNREKAMLTLKSKLYQKQLEEKERQLDSLRGEQKAIEWGSQIRSYVFCPYCLVKDHRSNYESADTESVMDGDIDQFIYAYLKTKVV